MTVVAYSAKHRGMASDSRCSEDGVHFTNCKKLFRLNNGAIIGTAGDSDDREVRAMLGKSSPLKLPKRGELAELHTVFQGILVFPRGQIYVVDIHHREFEYEGEWTGEVTPVIDKIVAIGHGQQFAYGAMAVGADPRDAVRAACKWDKGSCGLPVQWEPLR